MKKTNSMKLQFVSRSANEGFARTAVSGFLASLDPTVEELADIKTAVSEAVTNCIIHGYEGEVHKIIIRCKAEGQYFYVDVEDTGRGIEDIEKAMEPMFTTDTSGERSGMGFSFMEAFMDRLEVESEPGKGTRVMMEKRIGR